MTEHLKGLITKKWLDQTRKRDLASSEVEVMDKNRSGMLETRLIFHSLLTGIFHQVTLSYSKQI